MAETLRPGTDTGSNGPAPLDSEQFLQFINEHAGCESDIASAVAACKEPRKALKDLRKRIAEIMPIEAFDRALADRDKSGAERERMDEQYRQAMMWLRKPVGTQAAMDLDTTTAEFSPAELVGVEREGLEAGKAGERGDRNTYTPGTAAWAAFQNGWLEGQKLKVAELGDNITPIKRGRGRPRANGQDQPTPPAE